MAAPTTWQDPASGGENVVADGSNQFGHVQYLSGYWVSASASGTALTVRAASDPTATWSTALSYTPTSPYTIQQVGPIAFDGSTWAFSVTLQDTGVSWPSTTSQIIYSTTPTSSWSQTTMSTATTRYAMRATRYIGGQWVGVGAYIDQPGITSHPFIATSTAVTSGWTYDTSDSGTGSTGGVGFYSGLDINRIGSTYVFKWGSSMKFASSLTGSWTAKSTSFSVYDKHTVVSNGYLVDFTDASFYYTTDGDTYTEINRTSAGIDSYSNSQAAAYSGEYWLLGGALYPTMPQRVAYLLSSSPGGTYTVVNPGLGTSRYVLALDHDGTYFVAMDTDGKLRYSNSPSPIPVTTERAILRRRQSPAWAPSRVRPTDLRQRQTPYIT